MKSYLFNKESDYRWFVEIPEWEGSKEELEMVMGADTMLDLLSEGEDSIRLSLSDERFKGYDYELTFKEEAYDGANYHLKGKNIEFEVWLCSVTKFVFGRYPESIYIKRSYGK